MSGEHIYKNWADTFIERHCQTTSASVGDVVVLSCKNGVVSWRYQSIKQAAIERIKGQSFYTGITNSEG